ncbi:MAG: hypothetical protein LC793_24865 [Thermomicrobia bacterium]|nr:hypothetical protein [Thermomicrobia bacterium]
MATVTFIIPEKDSERARSLQTVAGVAAVEVAHRPFDPRSADAETQVVEESLLTVSFDPTKTKVGGINGALHELGVHVLAVREGE